MGDARPPGCSGAAGAPRQFNYFAPPGSTCSGHGTCVNASTAVSSSFASLCACDAGWSGASDLFDLRVAVDPATGAPLALDCPVPDAMPLVMYAVFTATHVLRALIILLALVSRLRQGLPQKLLATVSYTHLTLPTICSV